MINTETMQLDLFDGLVLTTDQQLEIDNFINHLVVVYVPLVTLVTF